MSSLEINLLLLCTLLLKLSLRPVSCASLCLFIFETIYLSSLILHSQCPNIPIITILFSVCIPTPTSISFLLSGLDYSESETKTIHTYSSKPAKPPTLASPPRFCLNITWLLSWSSSMHKIWSPLTFTFFTRGAFDLDPCPFILLSYIHDV
jgi:hypothetical protein